MYLEVYQRIDKELQQFNRDHDRIKPHETPRWLYNSTAYIEEYRESESKDVLINFLKHYELLFKQALTNGMGHTIPQRIKETFFSIAECLKDEHPEFEEIFFRLGADLKNEDAVDMLLKNLDLDPDLEKATRILNEIYSTLSEDCQAFIKQREERIHLKAAELICQSQDVPRDVARLITDFGVISTRKDDNTNAHSGTRAYSNGENTRVYR